jgi:hypothetical protein
MQFFTKTSLSSIISSALAPPRDLVGRDFTLSYGVFSLSFKRELQNYWREQWWHGYAGDGWIGAYAASTIKRKIKKGLPYDRVTLFETGNLYNSLYTRVEDDGIVIGTNVDYFVYLQNRYRGVLFKLHEDRKKQLADEIIKKIKEQWLKKK